MTRRVEWLGEAALLVTTGSPEEAVALAGAVRHHALPGVVDLVAAYHTLGVVLDPDLSLAERRAVFERVLSLDAPPVVGQESRLHTILVDYTRGEDLGLVARTLGTTPEQVVAWHTRTTYRVLAVGFVPGFGYLGPLPEQLRGVPRLASPRTRVPAGGVGLTGDQTAVYPLDRPGGWPLIGHTSESMVDLEAGWFRLQVGDRVRFAGFDS